MNKILLLVILLMIFIVAVAIMFGFDLGFESVIDTAENTLPNPGGGPPPSNPGGIP